MPALSCSRLEALMSDLVFLAVLLVFFALAAGYVRVCDRITTDDLEDGR
jgi:hypothetical protein